MMETFSRRTVEALQRHTLFRVALPPFKSFFDINVAKEVEKDRMVIVHAAGACQAGALPEPGHVETLLQEARKIDAFFIRKAVVFPVDIQVRYQDIEHYREQRFELLWRASYDIFSKWHGVQSFRCAVSELYSEPQFRNLLNNMLGLYAMETRMLSRSVRIPVPMALARDAITQTIIDVMNQEAAVLAGALARTVYRRRG